MNTTSKMRNEELILEVRQHLQKRLNAFIQQPADPSTLDRIRVIAVEECTRLLSVGVIESFPPIRVVKTDEYTLKVLIGQSAIDDFEDK